MVVEDLEFQLRLTIETGMKIKILADPLYYHRIHQQNESKNVLVGENVFNVLKKYGDQISDEYRKRIYFISYFNLGIKSLRGDFFSARSYFLSASEYQSGKKKVLAILMSVVSRLPQRVLNIIMRTYYSMNNYLYRS